MRIKHRVCVTADRQQLILGTSGRGTYEILAVIPRETEVMLLTKGYRKSTLTAFIATNEAIVGWTKEPREAFTFMAEVIGDLPTHPERDKLRINW